MTSQAPTQGPTDAGLTARVLSSEWQTMDTAPINKAVLIYIDGMDYYGNGGVYAAMLVSMGTGPHWLTFGWAIGRDLGDDMQPSAWMPLPTPPTNPKGAA